jgi:replicative DNA helicase
VIATYEVTERLFGDGVSATRSSARAWSVDAEQGALCCCLQSPDAIVTARELQLAPEHFADRTHQGVFRAILALDDAGTLADPITVSDWLITHGESAEIRQVILGLMDVVPGATGLAHYAGIVRDYAQRRMLQQTADSLAAASLDRRVGISEALDHAEQLLFAARPAQSVGIQSAKSLILPAMERVEVRRTSPGAVTGIATPFAELDRLTLGWQPSQLTILAARPSVGKTAVALQIAMKACQAGHRVLFFSLEMSAEELFERMWSMDACVPLQAIRSGQLNDFQMTRLAQSTKRIATWRLGIDDACGASIGEMRSRARRANPSGKEPIGLIIADYLQLVSAQAENRVNEVSAVSRGLKALAKELRVPVVALSQLSRGVEMRGKDAEPQLSDLRDSGAIEQDADNVLFLHRPKKGQPDDEGHAMAILAKQRQGPLGRIPLQFRHSIASFDTGTPPEGYGRVA